MTKKTVNMDLGSYEREIIVQGDVSVVIFSDIEGSNYQVQSHFEEMKQLTLDDIGESNRVIWICKGSSAAGKPVSLVVNDSWTLCESLSS